MSERKPSSIAQWTKHWPAPSGRPSARTKPADRWSDSDCGRLERANTALPPGYHLLSQGSSTIWLDHGYSSGCRGTIQKTLRSRNCGRGEDWLSMKQKPDSWPTLKISSFGKSSILSGPLKMVIRIFEMIGRVFLSRRSCGCRILMQADRV